MREHRATHQPNTAFVPHASAFKKNVSTFRKVFPHQLINTVEEAFQNVHQDLSHLLDYERHVRKVMKVGFSIHAEFVKEVGDGGETEYLYSETYFQSNATQLLLTSDMDEVIGRGKVQIQEGVDGFLENGSGWVLNEILHFDVNIVTVKSVSGACDFLSVSSAKTMGTKKWQMEVAEAAASTAEKRCFLDAVSYHFIRSKDKIALRKFADENLVVNIPLPVEIHNVARFEQDNSKLDIKIVIIGMEGDDKFPLYCSKNMTAKNRITLVLYFTLEDSNDTVKANTTTNNVDVTTTEDNNAYNARICNHFAYVEDIDIFLRNRKTSGRSGLRCPNCFARFTSRTKEGMEKALNDHYKLCLNNETQAVEIPEDGAILEFTNHVNKFPAHFTGYFDFESCHVAPKHEDCDDCRRDSRSANSASSGCIDKDDNRKECPKHRTRVLAEQLPICASYLIKDRYGLVHHYNTFSGYDCVEKFIKELLRLEPTLMNILTQNKEMIETEETKRNFAEATSCHICDKPLDIVGVGGKFYRDACRDHCHISGKYLGAAHQRCNLKRLEKRRIYLYAHNLTSYDEHMVMKILGEMEGLTSIDALPANGQKYRTIRFNSFILCDSLAFMQAPLSELADDLQKGSNIGGSHRGHQFPLLDQVNLYSNRKPWLKELLKRKGVFPYEMITSYEMLEQTTEFPAIEEFYSSLTDSGITPTDHEHGAHVYQSFECKNLLQYTELYCMTGKVLLNIYISSLTLIYCRCGNFG